MKRSILSACIVISSFTAMAFFHPTFANNKITVVANEDKIECSRYIDFVSISPNPQKNGTVTVASNISDTLRFYIFDADGSLVHQDELTNKQQKTITNIKKGHYTFDAFLKTEGVQHFALVVE